MKRYDQLQSIEILKADAPLGYHYLQVHRLHFRNHYPDGNSSQVYTYETVARRHLDAVAILLFEKRADQIWVHLRKTLRPSIVIREYIQQNAKPGMLQCQESPILLEVVAGILEKDDLGENGRAQRALAEIWEEAGFRVEPDQLISLGSGIYPTPGMNPEIIYLYAAEINPKEWNPPPGDGSVVEEIGGLEVLELTEAITGCREGKIRDAKTEISLHRLASMV